MDGGVENKMEVSSPKDLLGVSTANDISDDTHDDIDVEAQDGANAFRTLLFGRTFSLSAAFPTTFRLPVR